MSVEDMFITTDCTCTPDADGGLVTFDLIEDESGGMFWGYGHVDPGQFINEVNRWLLHTGAAEDRDYLVSPDPELTKVEHLWARMKGGDDERFEVVESYGTEYDAQSFPVTRMVL